MKITFVLIILLSVISFSQTEQKILSLERSVSKQLPNTNDLSNVSCLLFDDLSGIKTLSSDDLSRIKTPMSDDQISIKSSSFGYLSKINSPSSDNLGKINPSSPIDLNKLNNSSTDALFKISTPPAVKKKNAGLAILYSLLLPGMGELYAESYSSGKYFTIAEGALWGTYIGINTFAGWQKDRYKSFAVSNGGVNPTGKDDDYYAVISEYSNIYDYNNDQAKQREFSEMYNEQQKFWKWNGTDRKTYRSMWVSSEQAYNNVRFVVGAMLINRVASAINAVRLTAAYNRSQKEETSWLISAGVSNNVNLPQSLVVNFQTSF